MSFFRKMKPHSVSEWLLVILMLVMVSATAVLLITQPFLFFNEEDVHLQAIESRPQTESVPATSPSLPTEQASSEPSKADTKEYIGLLRDRMKLVASYNGSFVNDQLNPLLRNLRAGFIQEPEIEETLPLPGGLGVPMTDPQPPAPTVQATQAPQVIPSELPTPEPTQGQQASFPPLTLEQLLESSQTNKESFTFPRDPNPLPNYNHVTQVTTQPLSTNPSTSPSYEIPGQNSQLPSHTNEWFGQNNQIPGYNGQLPGQNTQVPSQNNQLPGHNNQIFDPNLPNYNQPYIPQGGQENSTEQTGGTVLPSAATIAQVQSSVVQLINSARMQSGLGQLSNPGIMQTIAIQRAGELSIHYHADYNSHYRPDGSNALVYISGAYGPQYAVGECVAWFDNVSRLSANVIFNAFMNSPPHRSIIMSAGVGSIGVGVYCVPGPVPDNNTGSPNNSTSGRFFVSLNFGN